MDLAESLELFDRHLAWSRAIARKVHASLPPSFSVDDLAQEAAIELWKRCQAYDPMKNNEFRGYAYLAVRGAVLMSVRRRAFVEATADELDPATPAAAGHSPAVQYQERVDERDAIEEMRRRRRWVRDQLPRFPYEATFQAHCVRRIIVEDNEIEKLAAAWQMPEQRVNAALQGGIRRLARMRAGK